MQIKPSVILQEVISPYLVLFIIMKDDEMALWLSLFNNKVHKLTSDNN